jgi:phosphoribosylglycinamide formyltransferase-1
MHSLIIFASGKGSNAQAIIDYFKQNPIARVALIITNKADAGVLDIAKNENISSIIINRQSLQENLLLDQINNYDPSLIILAGFLWKVPDTVTQAYRNKIINIHPALLPEHGGKGMYGHHVHNSVIASGKKETGITIHYVDEVYDSGDVILQARCPVLSSDNTDSLADRIHRLEHYFFPRTIEFLLAGSKAG